MADEPEPKAKPEAAPNPKARSLKIAAPLANEAVLAPLLGSGLVRDGWCHLYRAKDGSLSLEEERRSDDLPLLGRVKVEQGVLTIWEPWR